MIFTLYCSYHKSTNTFEGDTFTLYNVFQPYATADERDGECCYKFKLSISKKGKPFVMLLGKEK